MERVRIKRFGVIAYTYAIIIIVTMAECVNVVAARRIACPMPAEDFIQPRAPGKRCQMTRTVCVNIFFDLALNGPMCGAAVTPTTDGQGSVMTANAPHRDVATGRW